MQIKASVISTLKFLFPFAIWIILFKDFFTKSALIDGDTFTVICIARYFTYQVLQGVFPAWDPFALWGMGVLRQIGEFNPIWFLIPILETLGCEPYHAMLITIISLFFVGCMGFYCLTKIITSDRQSAYFAFLIFLFSSAGMIMFIQITFLMICVPVIWFMYFLIKFFQTRSRSSFLFLIYCLVQILTTYIPFYFITFFMAFLIIFILIYTTEMKRLFRELIRFITNNKAITLVSLLAVSLALYSQFMTWVLLKGDLLPLARPAEVTYNIVRNGGLPITEILRDFSLFSLLIHSYNMDILSASRELFHLKNFTFDNQRIFYIPFMAHICILTALWTRLNKKLIALILICFMMYWLVILDLTPLYKFLFENIFYFRMFRNVFFLLPFLLGAYVILFAEQFRLLKEPEQTDKKSKFCKTIWIVLIHSALAIFLNSQNNVCASTYFTLAASVILWISITWGVGVSRKGVYTFLLAVIILIQPLEILSQYVSVATAAKDQMVAKSFLNTRSKFEFSYSRPPLKRSEYEYLKDKEIYIDFFSHYLSLQDSPGFTSYKYGYPTKWSNLLSRNVNYELLRPYITQKFLLYDRIQIVNASEFSLNDIAKELQKLSNTAYIARGDDDVKKEYPKLTNTLILPTATIIRGDSENFQVQRFTSNTIEFKSNFKTEKFLVYNDSYHPQWRAWVNGKGSPIYRTNAAFKGIVLPAGANNVTMEYVALGGDNVFYLFMIIFYFAFSIIGLGIMWTEYKRKSR